MRDALGFGPTCTAGSFLKMKLQSFVFSHITFFTVFDFSYIMDRARKLLSKKQTVPQTLSLNVEIQHNANMSVLIDNKADICGPGPQTKKTRR